MTAGPPRHTTRSRPAGLAVGIDVAARRGCDVVTVGADRVARPAGRVHTAGELADLLATVLPAVVAIDAPSAWAPPGTVRACERELRRAGISVFVTPDAARGEANPFYAWMRTGFAMFAGATGYPTIETFPHAVAIALRGEHPARGLLRRPAEKQAWRRAALAAAGIDTTALRTIDQVDAALCAGAGRCFLAGTALALGDPREGVLTVPPGLPGLTGLPGRGTEPEPAG